MVVAADLGQERKVLRANGYLEERLDRCEARPLQRPDATPVSRQSVLLLEPLLWQHVDRALTERLSSQRLTADREEVEWFAYPAILSLHPDRRIDQGHAVVSAVKDSEVHGPEPIGGRINSLTVAELIDVIRLPGFEPRDIGISRTVEHDITGVREVTEEVPARVGESVVERGARPGLNGAIEKCIERRPNGRIFRSGRPRDKEQWVVHIAPWVHD